MIPYVGCISIEDSCVLRDLAEGSKRILEFGSGASTQIFAKYTSGSVDSVDTDPRWIDKTIAHLHRLGIDRRVDFHAYSRFSPIADYDLIFVDGVDELRREFAMALWPYLIVNGAMAFHDTRRVVPHGDSTTSDISNVFYVAERHSSEVGRVEVNLGLSNTSVIWKRAPLPYVNWQTKEDRTDAQMGL